MDAKDVIARVRSLLDRTLANGSTVIQVSAVSAVLNAAEQQVMADVEAEIRTHNLRVSAITYEHDLERDLEMVKLSTSTGFTALKTAVLINGGAVIALLAFMGSQRGALMPQLAHNMVAPLTYFTTGTMLSAFATGLGYLAQAGFGNEFKWRSTEIGIGSRIAAIVFAFAAYVAFGCGAYGAASVFKERVVAPTTIPKSPLPSNARTVAPPPTASHQTSN